MIEQMAVLVRANIGIADSGSVRSISLGECPRQFQRSS